MVRSKQVGGLTDLLHHPLVLEHLSSQPDPEMILHIYFVPVCIVILKVVFTLNALRVINKNKRVF